MSIVFPVAPLAKKPSKPPWSRLHPPDLHHFAKATLANDLQELKVFDRQGSMSILNENDADLQRSRSESNIQPIVTHLSQLSLLLRESNHSSLAIFLARLGILYVLLDLFESRVDTNYAQENVFTPTCAWSCVRVSKVYLRRQFCSTGDIKFVGGILSRPVRVLGASRYRIHKYLNLVEIEESVWKVPR